MENRMMTALKTRNKKLPYDPAIPLVGIYWENHNWKIDMYPNVYCNSRTWKQPRCPLIEVWIKKLQYTYTMDYYPAIKKQCIWVSANEVDEPRSYYTKWSKSEREKQISYIKAYAWTLERWYWWIHLQCNKGDADTENRLMDMGWGAGKKEWDKWRG